MDCIFCQIAAGEIPSSKVFEDDIVYAFKDINPQAPVHILIIPKQHICCTNAIDESNSSVIAHIFEVIPQIASNAGLINGYRIITNCGDDGCQTVKHLHFHIVGGTKLSEKMA